MSYGIIVNGLRRLAKELEDAQIKGQLADELDGMVKTKGKQKVAVKEEDKSGDCEEEDGSLDS